MSEPLRHEAEFIASGRISSSPRIRAFANAVLATLDAAREGPGHLDHGLLEEAIDFVLGTVIYRKQAAAIAAEYARLAEARTTAPMSLERYRELWLAEVEKRRACERHNAALAEAQQREGAG